MDELIEMVRQYKVIYDTKCPEYKDHSIRATIWDEIGAKMKQPPDRCKNDWNKLRNSYVNAMKRRKNKKSGQAAVSISPWKYEEQMSFLRPYMESRLTTTNLSSPPESPEAESEHSQSYSRPTTPQSTSSNPRPRESTANLQNLYDLMKSSHDLRQQRVHRKMPDLDETDMFFLSMSKAIKDLPKIDQTKIKLDLHTAISQAEIRKLEAQSQVLKTPIIVTRQIISPPNQPSTSMPIIQTSTDFLESSTLTPLQNSDSQVHCNFEDGTISSYYSNADFSDVN